MFDEIHALKPFKAAADLLAKKEDWPPLYDVAKLKTNKVCFWIFICFSFLMDQTMYSVFTCFFLVGACRCSSILWRYVCKLQASDGNSFSDFGYQTLGNEWVYAFGSSWCWKTSSWSFVGNDQWEKASLLIPCSSQWFCDLWFSSLYPLLRSKRVKRKIMNNESL